jgi:TolA-binding protein
MFYSTRLVARLLLIMAALAASAFGCAWFVGSSHSVRFNDYQGEREMARLPPLPTHADETNNLSLSGDDEGNDRNPTDEVREKRLKEGDNLWVRAQDAEKSGDLKLDRELLRAYLNHSSDSQNSRNSAFDRLDALTALDRGSPVAHLENYLTARFLHDDSGSSDKIESLLVEIAADVNLKDNVAYLRAAEKYGQKQFADAALAFSDIVRKYPRSEKREAALFMTALSTMKTSSAYTPTSGDEAHLHERDPTKIHSIPIDRAWHEARDGFRRLIAEYPRGRYRNDGRGWIAYLLLRNNDRAGALVEYYRLLADKNDENTRIEAAFSLELVRHHATDEQMDRVEKELAREPEVALAYAYHNLFNYAIHPSAPDWRDDTWDDEKAGQKERSRILAFSQNLMNRHPNLSFGAGFALRAAQASLELEKNEAALQFARRALQARTNDVERSQAFWTKGMAEHRLHQFEAARKTFDTLLRDYPKSSLAEGARRTLAMISEDQGDLEGALEQYVALDYRPDISYFIDTLMTKDQLADFIQRHPDLPKKNEFTYALGLRYLRANRWEEARKTFAQVRAVADPRFDPYTGDCLRDRKRCLDPKDTDYVSFEEPPPLTNEMLMRDVQTANDLEFRERAVAEAVDDEAKAEAMYQLASYQYEASSLLFYNAVAWHGYRYYLLSELANTGRYRATNESQILFAYMQEHDTLARALKVYLDVVDKFPKTSVAPDALYSAAVCHERLANYNNYWRDLYFSGLHAGSRLVTYKDVVAAYPHYQLPRGTYKWEPSTRTVNGGPGWAPPPKYIPPPTRMQRVKLFIDGVVNWVQVLWNEKLERWVTLIVILVALRFTTRIAKENRRLLRPKLMRLRIAAPKLTFAPSCTTLFSKDSTEPSYRDKAKEFLCERGLEFWELARDQRTRPILLRNVLSHGFLAGLVVSLLWVLHFG